MLQLAHRSSNGRLHSTGVFAPVWQGPPRLEIPIPCCVACSFPGSSNRGCADLTPLCLALILASPDGYSSSLPPSHPRCRRKPRLRPPRTFSKARSGPYWPITAITATAIRSLGGLRLDSRDGMLKGGKTGPAIVPGDPDKSLLIRAIQQTGSTLKMPQGGKLKDDEIENIVAWVNAGAFWPASAVTNSTKGDGKYVIAPERRNFWSLQPLERSQSTCREGRALAQDRHRPLRPRPPGEARPQAGQAGQQARSAAPRHLRSHRTAAHAGRNRRVRKRHRARCLRQGSGPPPGVAALRRALGPRLARRGALRRRRLSQPEPQSARLPSLSQRVRLSRLGDSGVQRRHALRPVRQGAARRRPAG